MLLDDANTKLTARYVQQKTARLEQTNPVHRHRSSWHIIWEFTSTNTVPYYKVPGGTTEQLLNIWFEHLKSLLKSTNALKSTGLDNITPSVRKLSSLHEDLINFCNTALIDGNISKAWTITSIVPVPKKGDLTNPNYYC